jgi:hypothetical protein
MRKSILRRSGMILLALFLKTAIIQAQEFDHAEYTWEKSPATIKLSEEEKKTSSLVISSKKFVEYSISKSNGVEKFVVTHTIEALNDDRAVEASNKIYVPINYHSKLMDIRARVIQNGKVISEQGIKDVKKLEEKEVQYYLLALEGVVKGSIVETIVSLQISPSLYAREYLQEKEPILLSQFTLVAPQNLIFKSKSYNTSATAKDTTIGQKRYVHYSLANVPAFEKEKYALENANMIRIEYAFEKNTEYLVARGDRWDDMGNAYFERLFKNYDKNRKDIDKFLKNVPLKGKSNEEKAFQIENYIKTNINLVQEAEEEDLIANVIKKKYANLFGITQLHVLCLERAGISFETVITCEKDIKRFDPDFDSWSFLDYVVIHLSGTDDYITPGNVFLRAGYLPQDLLGQYALFVKGVASGKTLKPLISIKNIGVNDIGKSKDNLKMAVTLNDDLSSSKIQYSKEMSNYVYMGIKPIYYMANEEQKKEMIESVVTNGIKEIKVSGVEVGNYDITSKLQYQAPLKIKATLETDAYLENAGDKVLFKLGELIGPQEEIYQEKKRQNPIDMPYAHEYNREIRVKIPVGRKLEGLEKIKILYEYEDKDGPMFGFASNYKMEGDELVVSCREHYNRISFPIEKFEEFRKVINAAADFNKITILVK